MAKNAGDILDHQIIKRIWFVHLLISKKNQN